MRHMLFATAMLSVLSACNVESGPEDTDVESSDVVPTDEVIGSVEQAFGSWGSWGLTSYGGPLNHSLGLDTGTAGFLLGVTGDIRGGYGLVSTDLGPGATQMHLLMEAGAGHPLFVDAGIVAPGQRTNGASLSQLSGTSEKPLGLATSNRYCYLTSICSGSSSNYWKNNSDYLRVELNSAENRWYLKGTGAVCGSAYCTTVTDTRWYLSTGAGTHDLGAAYDGKFCWLSGIGGKFQGGLSDGVHVKVVAGRWVMEVGTNKWGQVECHT